MISRGVRSPLTIAFGGMLTLAGVMGFGRFLYTPILPLMAADLGLDPTQTGLIASANFAGYLAGALLAAVPGLPGGRRMWMLAALLLSAVTTAAMGVWDGLAVQIVLRAAGGVASAFAMVFMMVLVSGHLAAAERSALLAVPFAGVGVGIALSALAAWAFAGEVHGWRTLWLLGGGATLVAALGVALTVPGGAEGPKSGRGTAQPGLWRLVLAYGGFGFGYVITATYIVAITRESGGGIAGEAAVWCAVGIAGIPSVWFWNVLATRFGPIRTYQAALLIEAAGVALTVLWGGRGGLVIGAVALGGTFMALTAMGFAIARRMSGADARAVLGIMTAAFGLGQMLGPLAAGALRDITGSYLAPSLAASAVLLGGVVLLLPLRRRERGTAKGAAAGLPPSGRS